MSITSARRAIVPGIAALALALSACGAGNEGSDSGSDDTTGASAETNLSGTLKGAGASSQEKAQEAWYTGFQGLNPDVTVEYSPVGSGDGRTQFSEGGVLFAGTDSYFNDDEGELSAANERCGSDIIEVPAYVSPIAVFFNLKGVDELNLSPDTIAQIFDNKITSWNDPAIAEDNPDVELPSTKITPVHRSDDSGTTKNFTDYLGKASKSWSHEAEDAFPVKGEAAEGTSGVVSAVNNTDGAIGYADHSQTTDASLVSVKVGDEFVAPSAEGAAKVIAVSPRVEDRPEVDMAVDVDRTTTEAGAYPIVLLSYLVACQEYDDQNDADMVKGYLTYVMSEDGQAAAADHAGSAPLDSGVAEEATGIVEKIAAK